MVWASLKGVCVVAPIAHPCSQVVVVLVVVGGRHGSGSWESSGSCCCGSGLLSWESTYINGATFVF